LRTSAVETASLCLSCIKDFVANDVQQHAQILGQLVVLVKQRIPCAQSVSNRGEKGLHTPFFG